MILAAPSLSACGDDSAGGSGGEEGTTGTLSTGITVTATAGDDDDGTSTGSGEDETPDSTADSTSSGGVATCDTILCGEPVVCCGADDACILGECVDACEDGSARCGEDLDICCDVGDVCLSPVCVTPGDKCVDSFDCPIGEFCEPTLDQCLPQQDPVACEIIPDFDDVEVTLEWSIIGADRTTNNMPDACDPDVDANCDDVGSLTTPLVGDIDGDGIPEVILNTFDATDPDGSLGAGGHYGHLIVLDGQTGDIQFRQQEDADEGEWGSYGRTTPGLADVDGSGLPNIIYAGRPRVNVAPFPNNTSLIHAIDGIGNEVWSSHDAMGDPYRLYTRQGGLSFGNWDSDDESEVVIGTAVLDNDGTVVFDQTHPSGLGGAVYGSTGSYWGGISAIADLDGDGVDEIISGREAWVVDWQENMMGTPDVTLTRMWDEGVTSAYEDGYPAIADIDLDGDPEVVVAGGGTLYILDGTTGELWCGVDFDGDGSDCVGNDALRTQPVLFSGDTLRGGPPTVADFDGDGRPEIGTASDDAYTVYDIYREDEDVVQPGGAPPAQPGELFARWTNTTQDGSASTGASVFDFQGDGIAEVVYADECYMRVYSGDDGGIILEIESSTATIHEYPVVADIDGDGNSELLVVANDFSSDTQCQMAGYTPRHGLFAYGDPNDQWLGTRQVWNSHTYHVTNATSTGLYPTDEADNWTEPGLNNYRQNVQGVGVFNAPDITVQLSIGTANCLEEQFEVIATVRNEGSIGVDAGILVSLFEGTDATGMLVGGAPQATPEPLLPGGDVDLSWLVPAPGGTPLDFFVYVDNDNGAAGEGALTECDEENQTSTATSVSCNIPG